MNGFQQSKSNKHAKIFSVISKNIASFLEENDLFIPDDEDDD